MNSSSLTIASKVRIFNNRTLALVSIPLCISFHSFVIKSHLPGHQCNLLKIIHKVRPHIQNILRNSRISYNLFFSILDDEYNSRCKPTPERFLRQDRSQPIRCCGSEEVNTHAGEFVCATALGSVCPLVVTIKPVSEISKEFDITLAKKDTEFLRLNCYRAMKLWDVIRRVHVGSDTVSHISDESLPSYRLACKDNSVDVLQEVLAYAHRSSLTTPAGPNQDYVQIRIESFETPL